MIKLLTLWATWRVLRPLVPILIAATVALLLLAGASRRASDGESIVGRVQHQTRPLEQQLQHTLEKAVEP